jgi:uncharacterized protein YegL
VLLLDTSGSMEGEKINALNDGLKVFKDDLSKDPLASRRVEVAVVSFNNEITVVQDFVTVDQFQPPALTAAGQTFMGAAVHKALDLIQSRKAQYKANGVSYYRPWVFLITDGEPQGEESSIVQQAIQRLKDDENNKRVAFFAVGVGDANMVRLGEFSQRAAPVKLKGTNFAEMFVWLSRSTQAVARAQVDDKQIALPPPGWGTV